MRLLVSGPLVCAAVLLAAPIASAQRARRAEPDDSVARVIDRRPVGPARRP